MLKTLLVLAIVSLMGEASGESYPFCVVRVYNDAKCTKLNEKETKFFTAQMALERGKCDGGKKR